MQNLSQLVGDPALKQEELDDTETQSNRSGSQTTQSGMGVSITECSKDIQLRGRLKPINQTLLTMGEPKNRSSSRHFEKKVSQSKITHPDTDKTKSVGVSAREASQKRKSVSPSGCTKGLINYAEYITSIQKEKKLQKRAKQRMKKMESARKNERQIFELEEQELEPDSAHMGANEGWTELHGENVQPFHQQNNPLSRTGTMGFRVNSDSIVTHE